MGIYSYTFEMQMPLFVICLLACLVGVLLYYKLKKNHKYKLSFMILFIIYLLVFFSVTIFPITIVTELGKGTFIDTNQGAFFQLIPGAGLEDITMYSFIKQIIGNILLFVPMYFFIRYIMEGRKKATLKSIGIGILASFGIELVQLLINIITNYANHICDIDDIICNTIGVVVGALLFMLIGKIKVMNKFVKEKIVYKNYN